MNGKRVRTLRSVPFQKRLIEVCDSNPHCPPLHGGRLVWLRKELASRGIQVSNESVSRWLAGEARPRQDKCNVLAKVLEVDEIWLFAGNKSSGEFEIVQGQEVKSTNLSLPIALRPSLLVTISGLPLDLSFSEAKKIAKIVLAHAVPASDGLAK